MSKRLPDEREAIEGAGVATATAADLLSSTDLLAGVGSYGIARSLAVRALEDSVKSRTLGAISVAASHGDRPGFSDDDLRKIVYSGHRERHDAGFVQYVAATFPDAYGGVMLGRSADAEDTAKIAQLRSLLAAANSAKQARLLQRLRSGLRIMVVAGQRHRGGIRQGPHADRRLRDRDAAAVRRVHAVPGNSGTSACNDVTMLTRSHGGAVADSPSGAVAPI